MKKTSIAALLLMTSCAVAAQEPAKNDAPTLQKMDPQVACYYANVAYSKGSIISAGDSQLQCIRTIINGTRSEQNPLEWDKL